MIEIDSERFEKFMNKYYKDFLVGIDELIEIDYALLQTYYMNLADQLEDNYKFIITKLERKVTRMRIRDVKTRIRIKNMNSNVNIKDIHQKFNAKWIGFEGVVKNCSQVFNRVVKAHWVCNNCGSDHPQIVGFDDDLTPPKQPCRFCSRRNGFSLNREACEYVDLQLINIEEKQDESESMFNPSKIKCYLKDDMVNMVNPGDKVKVNGVVELKNNKKENIFSEYVTITHLEREDKQFDEMKIPEDDIKKIEELTCCDDVYSKIVESIIPSFYGHDELKLALALHLFSSPNHYTKDGMYKRGDIHILLIGDPSVGKSQVLKYVSKLAPRGIYTSGKSASGAGLTATVVKDELGGWSLEAGAMILANNGNICIDEFDKMKEDDRSAIHEALEQQTVSISKAGINTTLHSKCSVLAAANPKFGRFDEYKSIGEQLNLSPTILSRFDLIFVITDKVNREQDSLIATRILEEECYDDELLIDHVLLQEYISYARKINPVIPREVNKYIADFFSNWRLLAQENNNPIPITARQLEAIARLSKASARIRLSDVVSIDDARRAIMLEKFCMRHVGFDTETLSVDADKVMGNTSQKERKKMYHMMKEFDVLVDDYANCVPKRTFMNHMSVMGYSKDIIRKWLDESLENTIVYNERDNTYSKL